MGKKGLGPTAGPRGCGGQTRLLGPAAAEGSRRRTKVGSANRPPSPRRAKPMALPARQAEPSGCPQPWAGEGARVGAWRVAPGRSNLASWRARWRMKTRCPKDSAPAPRPPLPEPPLKDEGPAYHPLVAEEHACPLVVVEEPAYHFLVAERPAYRSLVAGAPAYHFLVAEAPAYRFLVAVAAASLLRLLVRPMFRPPVLSCGRAAAPAPRRWRSPGGAGGSSQFAGSVAGEGFDREWARRAVFGQLAG